MTDTTFAEVVTQAQKQAISSLKQAQELSIRTAESALGLIPDDGVIGPVSVPPVTDVVEASFAFAGQVLDQQKAFAVRMTELAVDSGARLAAAARAGSDA